MGGLFFFVTAFFTWRNIQISEEKQVSERFSKAVEQLGSDQIQVRLGGIYALERLAKDSPHDHWTVMEVLTAFIRETSSVNRDAHLTEEQRSPVTTDVQAALTVIGRRNTTSESGNQKLDLSKINLSGANLSGAILSRAILFDAKLFYANPSGANLSSASFSRASLNGANLFRADLSGSILLATDLRDTRNLTQEQLEGEAAPLLCNTALPEGMDFKPDRDCDRLTQVLQEQYPYWICTFEDAQEIIDEARQKKWD